MKAILEFNLPEERDEFETAHKASSYRYVLAEFDNHLRKILKYDDSVSDEVRKVLQELRDTLNELAKDEEIEI